MELPTRSQRRARDIHRIEIAVDWPPGYVAVTLIDGPEPVLIDAGMIGEHAQETLESGLADFGHELSEVEHLVVTHPHVDHLGQIPAILEAADPTVYAPVGVRDRLTRESSDLEAVVRKNAKQAGLSGSMLEMAVEKSVKSLERNRQLLPPAAVDHWIEDAQEFTVGGIRLRAIHTPGHQADHCCYYGNFDGDLVLFSGDYLLAPFRSVVIHTGLDDGATEGVGAFYTTLEKLAEIDVAKVYPGHGPAHMQFQEKIERSRRSLDRMLDHTRDLVGEEPSTAIGIALERSGDREIQYVIPEVVGALAHLHSQGRIELTVDDGINRYYTED